MATCPSESTASPESELPPLLALPLEIKQDILAYLHDSTEPTLAILRRTHSSFYRIIPKSELRSKAPGQLRWQLLNAETKYPYLLSPGHYTCFECLCVLPLDRFSDNETRKKKGLANVKANRRFCLCCGVTKGRYGRYSLVPVGGITSSRCYSCSHFLLDVPFQTPLKDDCQAHLNHLAKREWEIFQAKLDRLKARGDEEKVEELEGWWNRAWCRRGRAASNDDEDEGDWLPDKTIPTPGEQEKMSILAYLERR